MSDSVAPGDELAFEEAFRRLEETVQALERGGLTLEEALSLYEEGMRLIRHCTQQLDRAELRITRLQAAYEPPPEPWEEDQRS